MSLPGADELFRTTGGMALTSSSPAGQRRGANGEARVPGPAGESDPAGEGRTGGAGSAAPAEQHTAADPNSTESSRGRATEAEQSAAAKGRRPQEGGAPGQPGQAPAAGGPQGGQQRRRGRGANRRPSGRERHDEKITVYVSAEELMDLEHARLVLRGEHGLAVDRGRIVREAVAVVLADLESRGDASILVRRLRGR
ncbi:hypothetical protein [Streptomyces corynorhini]|uniref:Cobyrinic acid a,c-diamide synthase n=1 Tax=Streptomyces corynorhini TaxID=2282652 RepID=A0A370B1P7_9ACTN|nr:hypothetical protein [Streptomyces corynorhini]RDG35748.1 hypothetical protein DVH02_23740 [Streptomyces corynorhini]